MKVDNLAIFIASYGKAENIPTLTALRNCNCTYPIYIVVGDDDPKLDKYQSNYKNLIVFSKETYYADVDKIGHYRESDKICTYSRLAVEDFARHNGIRYICYAFDDIRQFRLRYLSKINTVVGVNLWNFNRVLEIYIDLLNSSDKIKIVGPPNSSFYIGINKKQIADYSTRYGNIFVYDLEKPIGNYTASVLEDMDIILKNNKIGNMSICPFGMQVNCRDPKTTKDSYGNMTQSEWLQQYSIITGSTINPNRPTVPYTKFTPKIISSDWRKEEKQYGKRLFI